MSAFIESLIRLKERAEQNRDTFDEDTIPNPVAGLVGPQEFNYNPARDVPFIGGLINRAVNVPLRSAGIVQEAGGEAAKALFGEAVLAAAAVQRAVGDDNSEAGRDAARILAQGASHPGRALEAARTSEDDLISYLAGAGEMVSNPLNYTNQVGLLGQGLAASGKAPALGRLLQGAALGGELSNRASLLPLAALPKARASLAKLPPFLRALTGEAESAAAPALRAAQAAAPEGAGLAERLGNKADVGTVSRAQLDDTPSEDMLTAWLKRNEATGTTPQGQPGELAQTDWLRATLLKNLDAPKGVKYPRLAVEKPAPPNLLTAGGVGAIAENVPQEAALPGLVRRLEPGGTGAIPDNVPGEVPGLTPAAATVDPATGRPSKWTPEQEAIFAADPEVQRLTEMLDLYRNAPAGVMDNGGIGIGSDRQKRIKRLGFQLADARKRALAGVGQAELAPGGVGAIPDNTPAEVPSLIRELTVKNVDTGAVTTGDYAEMVTEKGHWKRGRKPKKGTRLPSALDTMAGMRAHVLGMRDELGRDPTFDEIRFAVGSGPIQTRDLMDFLAAQGPQDAPDYLADLDLMDSLRGRESVLNIKNLLEANYGTSTGKVLKNLTGRGSFNAEGRLVDAEGNDQTRSLLEYLLRRGSLSEPEREALRGAILNPAGSGAAAAVSDLADSAAATGGEAVAPSLRDLALDPQFAGAELPGVGYFTRRTGQTPAEVTAGLEALRGEGLLGKIGDWYGVKPGIQFIPTQAGVAASGAGLGAVAGLAAADTGDGDLKDDWGGALGGALTGAAAGAALATPGGRRNVEFAGNLARESLAAQRQAFTTGETRINWDNISGTWSAQTVQNVRNLTQEALSSVPMLLNSGGKLRTVMENANAVKDAYNAGVRGGFDLLPTRVRDRITRLGLTDDKGAPLVPELGASFLEATGRLEKALNPFVGAMIGAGLSTATPLGSVPLAGVALGAAKEFLRPMQQVAYETLDGITKAAFRSAVWEVAADDAAREAARIFNASVRARTGRALTLPADGYFSANDVRQALGNVPSGTKQALAGEWERLARAANATAEQAAKDAFGDFSKMSGAEKGLRKVVPFSSWVLRALPIAGKIAADHPAFTLALLGVLVDDAKQADKEGRPGYQVGTIPIDSNTPVVGKVADVLTGGRGGTARVSALSGLLPVGGQMFAAEEGDADDTLYQKVERWMNRAGFSFNPVIQATMYAVGQDWQRPGAMSRTANLEQALPGPDVASIAQGPLDFIRKQTGNSVSTTTPTERRIAQLVYEETGLPINHPENAAIAAATLDPNHPLVQRAERETQEGNVAKNLASLTVPVTVQANTDLEQRIGAARQAAKEAGTDGPPKPPTPDEAARIAIMQKNYPLQYALEQKATATQGDPLTQVYRGADQRGRSYQALQAWEDENAGLRYFAPTAYNAQKTLLMELLGIRPQY